MNPAQLEQFSKRKIPDKDGENVDIMEASARVSINRWSHDAVEEELSNLLYLNPLGGKD